MNIIEKFFLNFESKCGTDYCNTVFIAGEQKIVNNYECNQGQFSYLDQWKIQKQSKPTVAGSRLSILRNSARLI